MATFSPVRYSAGSLYDYGRRLGELLVENERAYAEIQQLLEETRIRHNRPEWRAYDASVELKRRLEDEGDVDDLPDPVFGEKPELYRQRLRKAIADRRARAACLDLRRRLMERGMDHVPIPRNSETPEEYRRRIRKIWNILADRRK